MSTEQTLTAKEQKLLDHVLGLPKEKLDYIRGRPDEVLKVIDDYSNNVESFMNVGPLKGKVIVEQIRQVKPKVMIELGGYVGYSAILFSSELLEDPAARYYSFEINEGYAKIARQLIQLAGLEHKVTIVVGRAANSLAEIARTWEEKKHAYVSVGFVFIDHWKNLYVPDLRVLESLNLIAPGTVIAADNIYFPGAPDYVKYVQGSPEERREHNYSVPNINGQEYLGRWNILYKSETIAVPEPNKERTDAVEITKCIEYLNG